MKLLDSRFHGNDSKAIYKQTLIKSQDKVNVKVKVEVGKKQKLNLNLNLNLILFGGMIWHSNSSFLISERD